MGAPKPKHTEHHRPARQPSEAEREAAEDQADVEELEHAAAEWKAEGRPAEPWDKVKRELDLK